MNLHIRLSYGLNVIEIENRDEDEGGDAGIKATVVEDEAAVHFCCYGANNSAHKACEDSVAEAVLSCYRAKSGCKGKRVDIGLG